MSDRYTEVFRVSDMNPEMKLSLIQQEDGDIIVSIDQIGKLSFNNKSVEFCTGMGGGRSLNTLRALKKLMEAMKLDNSQDKIIAGG